jgi:16S rRNA (uracil1498-N3)-methyltransferase
VNLILFEPAEISAPLSRTDPRATHLLDVLRRRVGDTFDAGLVDGPLGRGTLAAIAPGALTLTFTWGPPPPPPDPITLLVGLPRPQTARDILRDATTLGVAAIHFIATERSDANYAAATLWTSGEWRRHCLTGAAQAFTTRLPTVTAGQPLATALESLKNTREPNPSPTVARFALDNYEATTALSRCNLLGYTSALLAFGPERGWGPADREALRAHGFTLVQLGSRVLRSETAVVAALTLLRAELGLM